MIADAANLALALLVMPVAMFSRRPHTPHNRGRIATDDGEGLDRGGAQPSNFILDRTNGNIIFDRTTGAEILDRTR